MYPIPTAIAATPVQGLPVAEPFEALLNLLVHYGTEENKVISVRTATANPALETYSFQVNWENSFNDSMYVPYWTPFKAGFPNSCFTWTITFNEGVALGGETTIEQITSLIQNVAWPSAFAYITIVTTNESITLSKQ